MRGEREQASAMGVASTVPIAKPATTRPALTQKNGHRASAFAAIIGSVSAGVGSAGLLTSTAVIHQPANTNTMANA